MGTWGGDGIKRNKKENGAKLDGEIYQEYPQKIHAFILGKLK
ncbi:hypothetical protein NHP164001_04290 [Helicobacter trogontum]|uniref:Uncharacterized protein n=1 Tax=Helicobacter trogontum TaxID=50960 RepID=A0ABQ0D244_9HELI